MLPILSKKMLRTNYTFYSIEPSKIAKFRKKPFPLFYQLEALYEGEVLSPNLLLSALNMLFVGSSMIFLAIILLLSAANMI